MRKMWVLLVATSLTSVLSAQSPPVLTLEECIKRAEQYSFRLQSDEYEISAAEKTASLAKTRVLPRIDGELATDNLFLKPYYFNQSWAAVHADWSLGDYLKKTGRSAAQEIVTRQLIQEQTRLDVIGESTSLYISILQVKKQIEILGMRLKLLGQHYQLAEGLWKAGIRSQLDVLQTESEVVQLREDTSRLAVVRENLRSELSHLLGWSNTDSLRLMPVELDSIALMPLPPVFLESLADNPLLAAFDSRVKTQQFRTDELVAEQIPHLKMGSGFFADGDPSGDGGYFQINAGVIVPIFYRHEPSLKKQHSEAIVHSLESQKMDVERELIIHLIEVHNKMVNLRSLLDLQMERQAISARAVSIAEMNYKAGISSNLDFISAQQRLTDIQLAIEETNLEFTMNLIEYFLSTSQIESIFTLGK